MLGRAGGHYGRVLEMESLQAFISYMFKEKRENEPKTKLMGQQSRTRSLTWLIDSQAGSRTGHEDELSTTWA